MSPSPLLQNDLIKRVVLRLSLFIPLLIATLFVPAGRWDYWEAWLFLFVLLVPMLMAFRFLLKNNPELLERRLRSGEKDASQRLIIRLGSVLYFVIYALPGFDDRFECSDVPVSVVILADFLVFTGYGLVFWVLKENRYASRLIEVEPNQPVISTGPYAFVRHPMYSGIVVMTVFSPLALGSYWATIPALLIIPLLAARIIHEEALLETDLEGYRDYQQKTRYRLIPGVW